MSANMMYGPAAHSYFKPCAVEKHSRGRTLLYLRVLVWLRLSASEREREKHDRRVCHTFDFQVQRFHYSSMSGCITAQRDRKLAGVKSTVT